MSCLLGKDSDRTRVIHQRNKRRGHGGLQRGSSGWAQTWNPQAISSGGAASSSIQHISLVPASLWTTLSQAVTEGTAQWADGIQE